jgi:hypothetical protein
MKSSAFSQISMIVIRQFKHEFKTVLLCKIGMNYSSCDTTCMSAIFFFTYTLPFTMALVNCLIILLGV